MKEMILRVSQLEIMLASSFEDFKTLIKYISGEQYEEVITAVRELIEETRTSKENNVLGLGTPDGIKYVYVCYLEDKEEVYLKEDFTNKAYHTIEIKWHH